MERGQADLGWLPGLRPAAAPRVRLRPRRGPERRWRRRAHSVRAAAEPAARRRPGRDHYLRVRPASARKVGVERRWERVGWEFVVGATLDARVAHQVVCTSYVSPLRSPGRAPPRGHAAVRIGLPPPMDEPDWAAVVEVCTIGRIRARRTCSLQTLPCSRQSRVEPTLSRVPAGARSAPCGGFPGRGGRTRATISSQERRTRGGGACRARRR